MAPRFVYPIKEIENDLLEIHESLPETWLAKMLEDTDVEAVPAISGQLDVSLTMSGKDVVVRGTVRATVSVGCARCLQPALVPVEGELALLLVPAKPVDRKGKEAKGKEAKGEADPKDGKRAKRKRERGSDEDDGHLVDPKEAEFDTYAEDQVVLDGFLREAILLELPIFPLCSEACPGIGAVPSETAEPATAEETIDPRLAPLLELKKKSRL